MPAGSEGRLPWKLTLLVVIMGLTALGMACPALVSTPIEDWLHDNGLSNQALKSLRAGAEIRVYHRRNPLVIFSDAGTKAAFGYQGYSKEFPNDGILGKFIFVPLGYVWNVAKNVHAFTFSPTYNAGAMCSAPQNERWRCFVTPPGDVTVDNFVKEFARIDFNGQLHLRDEKAVAREIRQFVVDHEIYHGAIDLRNSPDGELHADRAALNRIENAPAGSAALQAFEMIVHVRALHMFNDQKHANALALERTVPDPEADKADRSALSALSAASDRVIEQLKLRNFGDRYGMERRYHVIRRMREDGLIDQTALALATRYMAAVEYYDKLTRGGVITSPGLHGQLDLKPR